MPTEDPSTSLPQSGSWQIQEAILQQIGVGLVVLDRDFRIACWNNFMAVHSQRPASEVLGRPLFEAFPELPEKWLRKKIQNVFLLGNYSFSSWEQRPFLFRFRHSRPLTVDLECMRQNSTFLPIKDGSGEVSHVCLTIFDVTEESLCRERLQESIDHDGLTGVYNRRYMERALELEFARVRRYGGCFSFLIFDLDHFKQINDTFGHLAGDQVLRTAAEMVRRKLRNLDLIGRYGGEEFVVILPSTPLEGARVVAERIREMIGECDLAFDGRKLKFTVSLGVVEWSGDMGGPIEMFRRADLALYRSKEEGRNRVTLFAPAGLPPTDDELQPLSL